MTDRTGKAEDTVVIVTSDNRGLSTAEGSPTSNLPLAQGKGWTEEGGIRAPLIVRWPGVVAPDTGVREPVTIGCPWRRRVWTRPPEPATTSRGPRC
ncbi:sulfatase-like hydrolase/transferase [Phytohabitans kaempferiae]|uniref:Sulfatase-like hydrolase/transferase n=1 Tax=Phytohabitans kaempferiae TaxID=1620943 RepID=A0ABV6MGG1_9ACTN